MIGKGAVYRLGAGGMDPMSKFPWDASKGCDCSGFAAWCIGVSRHTTHPFYETINGGWMNTTAIFADAKSRFGFFDEVAADDALPGHFLVWPGKPGKVGHIGIISKVQNREPVAVVHCSSGNFRTTGDAIRETPTNIFERNGAIVVRCALVE